MCLLHLCLLSFSKVLAQLHYHYSEGSLFILFMVSFAVQKLLSFIRSHLFIFVLISIALGDWPKKTLVQFMSQNILPIFSSTVLTTYLVDPLGSKAKSKVKDVSHGEKKKIKKWSEEILKWVHIILLLLVLRSHFLKAFTPCFTVLLGLCNSVN